MELTSSPSSNRPTVNDSTGVMNSSSMFSNHHDHDLPSPTITSPSHHQQYRMNFLSGASVASTSEDGHDDGEDEFAGEVKHILGAAVHRNTTIDASMQPQYRHQQQQHPPPISSVWAMNPHPSAGYANVVSSPVYSSASPPSSSYMPTSTSSYPHPPHQSHLQLHPPVQPQSHVYSHSQSLPASVTASASVHPSQSNIAMMQSQLEELQRQKALVEQQQQRMLQLQQMEQLQQQQQRALQMQQQQQQQRQHAHHPLQQQQHHHQQHSPQHHVPNAPSPHYHPQPGYNFGGPNMNLATQHSSYNHSDPHHRASPFIQSPTSYSNGSGNSKPPAQSPMPSYPHHLSRPSSQLSASPIECSTPSRKRDRSGSFSQHHQRLPPALPLDRPSSAAAAYPMLDNRTGYEHRRMISEHSLTSSAAGVIYDPAEEERATHIKRCRSACGDVNAIRMPLTNAHAQHSPMQLSKLSNLPPMPMPHLSPSNVTPSPSSANLPPATTPIEPKRPQHRRRKTEELLPHETWLCPYTNTATGQGCGKMYRTSSSRSISKHVAQCRHRPADSPATDHLPPGQTNAMLGAEGLREGMTSRKRKQTKRRKSSELAAHERWNCPYGCGQFFRSTSTKSIHRHKAECDRRTVSKDSNAPHLTPDQLMQVEYARIEELRQKQLADGFTHARIASPPDTVHERRPSGGDAARSSDEDESGDEYSQSSDDAGEHASDSESAYSDEDTKPADGVGTKAMEFPPVRRRSFPDVFAESTLPVDPLSESIAKGEPLQMNMSFAGLGADDFAAELSSAIAPRPAAAAAIATPNLNAIEMSIKVEPTNEGDTDMNVTLSPMNGRPQIISSSSSSSSVVGNNASANQLQHKLSELQRLQHQISQHQHHQPQHHPHPSQPNSNSTRGPSHPHPSQQHGQTNSPYGKSNEFDPSSLMRPQQPNQQQQPYHSQQQQQQVHGHLPDQRTDAAGLLDGVPIAGNEDTAALLRLLLQRQQHENQLLLQKSQLLQAQQQALSSSLSARELERPSSSASMRDLATDMSNLSWQNQQTAATKSVLQQQQQQQQHHHQHQQQASMPPYASYATMNNSTNPYGSHPYEHGLTPHHRPASSLSNSNIANQSTPASTGPALDHHMAPTPTTTLSSPSAATMASRQSGSSSIPGPGLSSPQGQGGLGQGQGHNSSLISPHQPKKMMKCRRIGTQLPPHERWTCPLKCGKFYKKSSSNSIRRHSLICLTALHAKSDPVTPVTSAELLQMIVGGVDRSKKKKKKEKAAQARAARQASQPKQTKTNSNDGLSHTNNRNDADTNLDGSASYHPGPPSPSLSSECSDSSESSTDYPLPPPPAPNAQLDANSKTRSLFPSTISASSSSVPPLLLTPSDLLGLGSFEDEPDEDEFEYDENEDEPASEEEQQQETTDDAQLAALLDQ